MTGCDFSPIFALGARCVLVFSGNAGQNPVGHRWFEREQLLRLVAGLVFASAHHGGSLKVELSKVGASLPASRIQFNGTLKRTANFFCHACSRQESDTGGLLAIRAAQPKVIETLLRVE